MIDGGILPPYACRPLTDNRSRRTHGLNHGGPLLQSRRELHLNATTKVAEAVFLA